MFGIFASGATEGPSIHIAPGEVMRVAGVEITNSMLYGWICTILIVGLLVWVARQVTVRPKGGIVQFVEIGVDFITDLVEGAFENAKIGRKYVPFFVILFFFIILNNWMGLIPIAGEGFKMGEVPLFRPFTADLSSTMALGAITMVLVYIASIRESGGLFKYLRHFFVGNPRNPAFFFIGLLEMLTDLTRVLSLSLRLFLNITIGEIIISVFGYLGHMLAPASALPFYLIEILVAALQAYIFTILGTMYLALAVNGANDHSHDEKTELTDESAFETIEVTNSGVASG